MKYLYVLDKTRRVGVIAIHVDGNKIKYNYSCTHDQDKFNKEVGKQIANQRLIESPKEVNFHNKMKGYDIFRKVLKEIIASRGPTKIVKFGRAYLKNKTNKTAASSIKA